MFRKRPGIKWLAASLVLLLIVLSVAPSLAMAAVTGQNRRNDLTRSITDAGTLLYNRNSKAYLETALNTLQPYASDKPGGGIAVADLNALRSDLDTAFFDVSRAAREEALERTLRLAQDVYSGYNNGSLPDPAVLTALTDLLLMLRQTAEAALTDARIFVGYQDGSYPSEPPSLPGLDTKKWNAAINSLRQAETAYNTAFAQLQQGNAEAGGRHFLLAWQKAQRGMGDLGLHFQPGQVTDLDGDGVPDQLEVRYGASPLNTDSDGDGLLDAFEIFKGGATFLPASADTIANGTPDGEEDSDRDGLTNLQEQALGTDPLRADSDNDGVKDGAEGPAGSDPLQADADGDGLNDAAEKRVGTDPNNPDTDGDAIPDGQDLLTGTVESSEAKVTITGTGDVAGTVSIRSMADVPVYLGMAGLVGSVAEIKAGLPFVSATVELPVPVEHVPNGDVSGLRMMYFDEETAEWRQVEGAQGYDPATGRFWAETTHFTAFAVFYIPNWDDFWTVEVCGEQGEAPEFIDVALVLDSSGSMSWNDPDGLRRVGAKRLVDGLLNQDQAAVVDFDSSARVWAALTSNKAALHAAIDMIDDSGGTNIGAGVNLGLNQLATSAEGRGRIMVLLTDGVGSYSHVYTARAVDMNVAIYTIGLGWDIDIPLLQTIASQTGGLFYHVTNPADLPSVFERVGDEVGDRDTDRDTLSNCEEIDGMPDVNGKMYTADKEDVDTDGDGLTDDEEMGEPVGGPGPQSQGLGNAAAEPAPAIENTGLDDDEATFKAYVQALKASRPEWSESAAPSIQSSHEPARKFKVESDPRQFDTDGDGLDDSAEIDNGTSRVNPDGDGDGLNDYMELVNGTAPDLADTDGDGFTDAYEVAHLTDGFDPLVQDEHLTPEEWARDFADGLAVGDACDSWLSGWTPCKGTIPFFLGQLSGGATSFIPVVGWIIGGIADLRDAIGNAVKGEWVGAGLSLVGIIPYVGDVGKIAGKVADFVSKFGKLEGLLRAVLRILPRLMGTGSLTVADDSTTGQFEGYMAVSGSGPPVGITAGNPAVDLVMEVLRKVNPAGYADVARHGDNDFLAKLAVAGSRWQDLGTIFNRLESTGLFSNYPRMQEFISDMIKATPDDALYGTGNVLTLNGRVTLNIKKAAARLANGDDSMIGIMSQHLRGALGEHRTYDAFVGDDLIAVGHVTARGPDRVLRSGSVIDVVESKAMATISRSNIKKWLIKRVEKVNGVDETIYEFNGVLLDRYLREAGQPNLQALLGGNTLRYNLFQYDQAGGLTSELAGLFNGRTIPIKGFEGANIQLIHTPFFP
jgi:Mg-chelatase subunit ChlD